MPAVTGGSTTLRTWPYDFFHKPFVWLKTSTHCKQGSLFVEKTLFLTRPRYCINYFEAASLMFYPVIATRLDMRLSGVGLFFLGSQPPAAAEHLAAPLGQPQQVPMKSSWGGRVFMGSILGSRIFSFERCILKFQGPTSSLLSQPIASVFSTGIPPSLIQEALAAKLGVEGIEDYPNIHYILYFERSPP